MKPALTHLAAALAGGVVVFLATGERRAPERDQPSAGTDPPTKSGRNAPPPSSRSAVRLRNRDSPQSDPQILEPGDFEAFMEKLGARKPTRAQLETYLDAHGRAAGALLGAALIEDDPDWLREALEKGADTPQVLIAGATFRQLPLEERLKWARRLHELQPDNALASYLLASRLFESGEPESALAMLRSSTVQGTLDDFSTETILAMEDVYRQTSGNILGAKLQSTWGLPLPMAGDLAKITQLLGEQRDALPAEEAGELRTLQASIGLRVSEDLPTSVLLTEVIGLGLQANALQGLPGDAPSPFQGLSVNEANASLRERKNEIIAMASPGLEEIAALPPSTIESYIDRVRLLGEFEAIHWLNQQIAGRASE